MNPVYVEISCSAGAGSPILRGVRTHLHARNSAQQVVPVAKIERREFDCGVVYRAADGCVIERELRFAGYYGQLLCRSRHRQREILSCFAGGLNQDAPLGLCESSVINGHLVFTDRQTGEAIVAAGGAYSLAGDVSCQVRGLNNRPWHHGL
jgi:hypothetical protein